MNDEVLARLAELAEEYKEESRLAMDHQKNAYFKMCEFLELAQSGDMEEAARIYKIVQSLKF